MTEHTDPEPQIMSLQETLFAVFLTSALKKEILQKARLNHTVPFNGEDIQLFQDLSPIRLKNRRALKPQHLLHGPDDLVNLCENLQIAPVELPDWYAEFRLPPPTTNQ